jgi:general secretion pathway protein H
MKTKISMRGVTLLEMLVVLVLASVLLALVFPSIGAGLRTLELRSAAQRVAATARYAREQAVHRQRFYALEIDAEAGRISITDFAGEATRSFELPGSVRVERIVPEEPDVPARLGRPHLPRRFLFSPDGSAPAFELVLANERRRAVVTSNPLTGFARIVEEVSGES